MALQKCHECGKDVSSEADKCPNCGAKVKKNIMKSKLGCLGIIGFLFFILFFIGIITDQPTPKVSQPSPPSDSVFSKMTADQHLKMARNLIDKGSIKDARQHLTAIKQTDTEFNEAQKMVQEVVKKEEANKEDQKRRSAQAIAKMRQEHDDVEGITWYADKSTVKHINANSFHLYIGKHKSGNVSLRMKIQYAGSNWLFIHKYIIKADNQIFEIIPSKLERDNYATVWEWSDDPINRHRYEIVQAVIKSKNAKIRHEGKTYQKDRIISNSEKVALRNVLNAYQALGGKFDFHN
jgi:DNA-directed RNA polymerase subunit RPC12/RpoP